MDNIVRMDSTFCEGIPVCEMISSTGRGASVRHWNTAFSVADLAKACCVSESTIYHLFQRELGQTPVSFLNSIRINVAIEQLENTSQSISAISESVGFRSENHFRRVFADLTGMTPLKYRKAR